MKTISLFTVALFMMVMGVTANSGDSDQKVFQLDNEKSQVYWTGKKVTGEHTGTIDIASGSLKLEGDQLQMADVKMDMNTIVVTDLKDPQYNKKLVDHLKSDDFFSVDKFPQSHFKAKKITPANASADGNYTVTGDLTIKGITHEVSFPVDVDVNNSTLTAKGSATLDRTKWDVRYGSGSFFKGLGDNMIYDDFEITFDLVAHAETVN